MSQPNRQVIFLRLADGEYLAAFRWYARRSRRTAQHFKTAVDGAVGLILAQPAIGSPSFRGCRWVKVRRFPYLLHYSDSIPGLIQIVAVAHQARRPGYWKRRRPKP